MTKPPAYYIRIRSYREAGFVSVWLCAKAGDAHSGLLHGEMLPALADELAAATGLPVERETSALEKVQPQAKKGCATVAEQGELFA